MKRTETRIAPLLLCLAVALVDAAPASGQAGTCSNAWEVVTTPALSNTGAVS